MEHRCRRGDRCAAHELLDDGRKIGAAIEAPEGLCDTCYRHVERAITSLPADYTVLNTLLGKGSTAGGEPVKMTKDLPVPIRLHIESLQREMVTEAAHWATSVAGELNVNLRPPKPGGVRPGWILDRSIRLIERSLDTLLELRDAKHIRWEYGRQVAVARDGYDGALVLMRLHQKARAFSGQTRLVHQLPVPCPRCEMQALEREDGSSTIDCTDCGRRYLWDEYEQLCTLLVGRMETA